MTLHRIDYKDGDIWVDKETTIQDNDLCHLQMDMHEEISKRSNLSWDSKYKIVAQSPNLSLPNIPYVEIEEDFKLTADQIINNHLNLVGPDKFDVYSNRNAVREAMIMYAAQEVKAASAKKYTEEGVRKAFQAGHNKGNSSFPEDFYTEDEFIQSLRPKIKSIEIEEEQHKVNCHTCQGYGVTTNGKCGMCNGTGKVFAYYKPIAYQKDGKTFLKVKQVNYE